MDRMRFSRDASRESKAGSMTLQKKLVDVRLKAEQPVPDLTDFMNDMFFGVVNAEKKAYNFTGGAGSHVMDEEEDFECSSRSNSSRQTQEWLEEARRMVSSSPSRCDSPSRLVGSPRFAAAHGSPSLLDRRDPLSRSARRSRAVESFSGEILSKSAKHTRNNSETLNNTPPSDHLSPASAVNKWFSNILKPSNPTPNPDPTPDLSASAPPTPRQSMPRKSRFQTDPFSPRPQGIPTPTSRRTFKNSTALPDSQLLPPSKDASESTHRRTVSSSTTCSFPENHVLSPPRNLVESAHRRSISSSTCSMERIVRKPNIKNGGLKEEKEAPDLTSLNVFLKEQRIKLEKISNREIKAKAKMVLSGPSNSTSSMVAAICYAWLLENQRSKNKDKGEGDGEGFVVVPVMNMSRESMWKHRQAAWLFYHAGVDATSLLFADEVDLESRMMAGQLNILVVGQDVLRTNGEVGSQCTILTDNYCENAYDLLQTTVLKKLLLAGILLDTKNLSAYDKSSMTRDSEAVQLLLVGTAPNYRYAIFDQLMQDQIDKSFLEALQQSYGKRPYEGDHNGVARLEQGVLERKSATISDHEDIKIHFDKNPSKMRSSKPNKVSTKSDKPRSLPVQPPSTAPSQKSSDASSHGKPVFFLAKWFGFGPK
ncbi:uncharacterized protein LOC121236516 [Juglans microcarpa x Juglans regia]|uniref:uncharacterized protein LOC121236516 n=1 Tax=Juglans microcarpa x Juglans regia TaxID=2249226 RepID=UPI001B7E8654|nr:uncharacterized protein LOC121236516 [Juglans microcarpa x Juglans regia]